MTKTKKLAMELPQEGRFISSEFPILRENLTKLDQAIADVEEKLDNKAPAKHTHSIGDVADLEAVLKGKMAADKTFTLTDLGDIEGAQDAANNYVLYKASNNHFTFGSAVSLLGAHQHKIEDIVGLDAFKAKINEDLTSYGHLARSNEWQNYNKFTSKVTMSGSLELLGNSSLNLIHNGRVVTNLTATGSVLKGPLKVDGAEVYSKDEAVVALQEIRDEITKLRKATSPLEVLVTQSGTIPWPEGVSDNTNIEIWAWGGGGGGGGITGGGGGGGASACIKIKGAQLKNSQNVQIGHGGKGGNGGDGGRDGGKTIIERLLVVGGGGGGSHNGSGNYGSVGDFYSGGPGGSYYSDKTSVNGNTFSFSGGGGGSYGKKAGGDRGWGGASSFGGGGGSSGDKNGKGGCSGKGGNGGNSGGDKAGGGGGYFPGKSGDEGGDGGNGAVLLRFFI